MNRLQQTIAAISLRDLRPRRARSSSALADRLRRSLLLVPLLFACAACAQAQTQPAPSPTPQAPQAAPTPTLERQFFKNILHDQRAIWTAPFHRHERDARWLVPLGLTAGVFFATDRRTAGALEDDDRARLQISKRLSYLGSIYGTGGVALGFYLVGRARHDERARETGLLAGEALIDSGIVSGLLKAATARRRPRFHPDTGEFFEGGDSFPSGHSIAAWSVATVVANEYHDRRLVQVGAYGLAAAVSVSRYTGHNHFLSDVLVGSALGYGIGRYVYRTHHNVRMDDSDNGAGLTHKHSKLWPLVAPRYAPSARVYGATLAWNF